MRWREGAWGTPAVRTMGWGGEQKGTLGSPGRKGLQVRMPSLTQEGGAVWKPPLPSPLPASVTNIPMKGLGNQSNCPRLPSPHPSPNTSMPTSQGPRGPRPTHSTVTGSACRGPWTQTGTVDNTAHSGSVTCSSSHNLSGPNLDTTSKSPRQESWWGAQGHASMVWGGEQGG